MFQNDINEVSSKPCTDFLFICPSFLHGMGSVLNIRGRHYHFNYSSSPTEADSRALINDWRMVGLDFRKALDMILR